MSVIDVESVGDYENDLAGPSLAANVSVGGYTCSKCTAKMTKLNEEQEKDEGYEEALRAADAEEAVLAGR